MDKPKIKIAIISHAQVIPVFQNRWKRLAKEEGFEVHVLVPEYWEQTWFGEKVIYEQKTLRDGDYYVHTFPTTSIRKWNRYLFKSLDMGFKSINPDLIYIIHEEGVLIHQQVYLFKKLYAPEAKIIFFSMNGLGVSKKKPHLRLMWESTRHNTDAAIVHYPGCVESLRNGGYKKPIFMQTQVGVDEGLFRPDEEVVAAYKEKVGFAGKFVVGYVGRLTEDKGIPELINVFLELASIDEKLCLLLVGNGNLKDMIIDESTRAGLEGRVHVTGFVDQAEVSCYMNAMDTFVLCSRTTPQWIDTFPLVTVQAQACGVPVIASDSASIPWQLGDSAKIFKEGDVAELKGAVKSFIEDQTLRQEYAEKGRERCLKLFCHEAMTENFKQIASQVLENRYIFHEKEDGYVQWKAVH